jgi:prepilin peptidase CpaA
MSTYGILMIAPALALLVWAAAEDVRSRRIPNWLTFSLVLSGIVQSFTRQGMTTPTGSLLGMLTGFALTFGMFALGALGGGDVKLLSGIGAWFGPQCAFVCFCLEAIIGMVLVLVQATAQGRLRVLVRNSAVVAINLAHVREVGVEHAKATGQSCRSVDRPLPYAVPVLIAMTILIARSWRA